jgi:hypothetical protein
MGDARRCILAVHDLFGNRLPLFRIVHWGLEYRHE